MLLNNWGRNMMNFSVSMCVYGGDNPEHFDIALESIVNQTLKPAEIVLVVDGPVPKSIDDVIAKYKSMCSQNNIDYHVFRLKQNKGHGIARQLSFKKCSNELVALMDADDISVSDRFEKQIKYIMKHPDVSIIGGMITEFISQDNASDISKKAGRRIVPENDIDIKNYMKKRCPMNQMTVMFKKTEVSKAGGYIDWYCDEDYYLWIRMALNGSRFANLPVTLVNVRVGEEMYQRRGGFKYFKSEAKLQRFMLQNSMIGFCRFFINIVERLAVQVLMPNRIRSWVFQNLARG